MTDGVSSQVVRGGAHRMAAFAVVNLLAAAGAVLLLRHLGVADFGRYGTVLALLTIVQGVTDAGLSMTGSREISLGLSEEERRETLAHVLGLRIVLTAAGVALAVVFALAAGYDHTMVVGTLIAGAGVFVLSVQAAMLLPLTVELRNGRIAANEVLRQGLLAAAFAVLVVAGAGLLPFFAAQLAAAVALLACTPLILHRRHFVAPRWERERLRDLAVVGLPVAAAAVLGVVYFRILVVLMSVLEDNARELGLYATSARVMEVFLGVPFILIGIVLPVMSVAARDDEARLRYITARLTELAALAGVAMMLFVSAGASVIVRVLGGAEYADAAGILQVQSLALITIFLGAAWTPTLVGMGRTRLLAVANLIGLVAVVVLGLVLIPRSGADGAALAAVLADLLLCAAMLVAVRRAGPGRAIEVRPLILTSLAAIPAVLVAFVVPMPDVVAMVVAPLAFGCVALALGVVPAELTQAAKGALVSLRGARGRPAP